MSRQWLLNKVFGWLVLAVVFAILLFFLVIPVGTIVVKAFYNGNHFTLEFFELLFASPLQVESIVNSLLLGVATTFFCTMVSLPLALIAVRRDFPLKPLILGLLLTPMVMPPFVGAIGLQKFFARLGSVNLLLLDWGWITEPIEWLAEGNRFWAVVLLGVLHLYPIMYLNLSAALANVDPSVEEMAKIIGCNRWQRLKDILWPLARPGYFAGAIIVFIWSFTDLGTPLLIGYNDVMPVRIFNMVSDVNENPVGFALVFCVIVLTAMLFLFSKYLLNRGKFDMLSKGHVTSPVKPASWASLPLIYAIFGFVIAAALIPHFSVLLTSLSDDWFMTPLPEKYTLEHFQQILQQDLTMIGIKNSVFLASFSTFVDLVLGLLVAYVITRKLIPFGALLDALVMIPLALPGIVLAFGYVVTYSDTFLDPMLNPIPLLIIAYGIRRLPYMVRSATAGLQQTSVSLEEASYCFGASKFRTIFKITLPLVMANVIAGALLCFAYAMLDVSDSLILAMKDQFYPITKVIYALYLEHGKGELIASAMGMIAMAILVACILGSSLLLGKKMGELFRS